MKKHITIAITTMVMVMLMSGSTLATQPKAMKMQTKSMQKQTTKINAHQAQDMKKWLDAQAWLKSVGYDKTIEQMKEMKTLNLQKYSIAIQQQITNENMRHVALLTNLETLRLPGKIGDDGLKHCAGLTKLTTLNMPQCNITDAGMQYLKNMTRMNSLVMSATNISDAGVAQIRHLRPTILNLTRTKITDAGVAMLKDMPLRLLFISFTDITDASVPVLAQLRGLERLDIQGRNGISQTGFNQLQSALPGTRIVYP